MKYDVTFEETVVQTFEIEANSLEEAAEVARTKYKNGELVVENGEVHSVLVCTSSKNYEETTGWTTI
jgi:hypothetical protein